MMLFNTRKLYIAVNVFCLIMGALIACLGIFCHEEFILFICVTLGISIILVNLGLSFFYFKMLEVSKFYIYHLVCSIISIVLAVLFIIYHDMVISIVFGCYLLLFPVVRICVSTDKKAQALKEIPYFALGSLLLFNIHPSVFQVAIIIFGFSLALLAIANMIISYIKSRPKKIDDGVIDITYKDL